ncbi:methyltransferase [Streptomyces sp. CB01881]|uniref:methyltransferase n=1 Tax=Streptomyces sp. CB01881 TaxID=2078691 RepID=UPI000CDBCC15|nr:methyltransferase [Streptomyces sp. CB01881]AUY52598.1 hypothetical protein C2142_30960 [Streptomyces sp. CB01881]TYC70317.1 methyltransferase domain-containing protein [Streptomyces sp. CB01881]
MITLSAIPALVSALRELGDRPAVVVGDRAISGLGLLVGVAPQGGLPQALAERIAALAVRPSAETAPVERRLRHWAGILGPPPIRHTVLYPATELGIELALATLLAGGTVICDDPEQPPDELPARLEQSGTTHLSLPSDLLWRLSRLPSLQERDLTALRRVLHIGPEPSQDDVYAAMDALGAVIAHVRQPQTAAEVADATLRAVMGIAADDAWKQAIGVTADHARLFVERLDNAALTTMLRTLQQAGVLDDPARGHTLAEILEAVRVSAEHRPLVERWLHALVRHQLITRRGGRFQGCPPVDGVAAGEAWDRAATAWTGQLGPAAVIDHLRRCADRLPGMLSGGQHTTPRPPGETLRAVDTLARRTVTGRYLGSALGTAVRHIAASPQSPRPLRVLELGAGTGATTEAITDTLAACGAGAGVDYLCTDRSALLLGLARARLRRHPWLRFGLLDPYHGPSTSAAGPFDVVVSTGVLSGAPDAEATARRLAGLAPGGWLLAVEPTREHLELLLSRVFLAPMPAGDGRPASSQRWLDALTAAGLGAVLTLPGEAHPLTPLGHQLFATRLP